MVFDDGSVFTGDFLNDRIYGNGLLVDQFKNKHENVKNEGYFSNRSLFGKGRIVFANRDVYEGNFNDGHFSGYGEMTYKNIPHPYYTTMSDQEAVYKGQWKLGRKHG